MFRKRAERLEAMRTSASDSGSSSGYKRVSEQELFNLPGASYNFVKVPKVN